MRTDDSTTPVTLTLLSYNIHNGVGLDGVLDLDRIADVIAASGADVVGLQEVDRHRRERSVARRQRCAAARSWIPLFGHIRCG